MTELVLTDKDLRGRRKDVLSLVAPLVDRNRVEVRQIGNGQRYTWGLIPKGFAPSSVVPDSVRVATTARDVYMNYYEVWLPGRVRLSYYLERAYMHFHLKRGRNSIDQQILCLHCDPALQNNDRSFQFKKGPHLHIGGAAPNIDRSHIAICLGDPDFGGATVEGLTQTLHTAVKMIETEVFPCYR